MSTKEAALKIVQDLVERFEEQLPSYKKQDYNETLVRRDFIDPFWEMADEINNIFKNGILS